MEKIKLPWRRFGDERPMVGRKVLLCFEFDNNEEGLSLHETYLLSSGDWFGDGDERDMITEPSDRWIYLSEIANPFEEEK